MNFDQWWIENYANHYTKASREFARKVWIAAQQERIEGGVRVFSALDPEKTPGYAVVIETYKDMSNATLIFDEG